MLGFSPGPAATTADDRADSLAMGAYSGLAGSALGGFRLTGRFTSEAPICEVEITFVDYDSGIVPNRTRSAGVR